MADLAADWPRRLDLAPWERGRGAVQSAGSGRGRINGGGGERRTAGFPLEVAAAREECSARVRARERRTRGVGLGGVRERGEFAAVGWMDRRMDGQMDAMSSIQATSDPTNQN